MSDFKETVLKIDYFIKTISGYDFFSCSTHTYNFN